MKTLQDVMRGAADVDVFGLRVRVSQTGRVGVALWKTADGMIRVALNEHAVVYDYERSEFRTVQEEAPASADVFIQTHLSDPGELEVLDGQGVQAKLVDAARIGVDRLRACGVEVMAGASCPEDLITVADLALANLSGLKEVVGPAWLMVSGGVVTVAVESMRDDRDRWLNRYCDSYELLGSYGEDTLQSAHILIERIGAKEGETVHEAVGRLREAIGPAWLKDSKGDLAEAVRLKCARLEKDPADLSMVITRDDIGPSLVERIAGYRGQLLFIDRSVVKAVPEVAEVAQGNVCRVHYFGGEA